jgi:hypothetical protein
MEGSDNAPRKGKRRSQCGGGIGIMEENIENYV